MREYTIKVTGPHCGTITLHLMTYAEALVEQKRLEANRHARIVEIVRAN